MLSRSVALRAAFRRVVVVGGGTMGGGIAQTIAACRIPATVVDVSDESLKRSEKTISATIERMSKKILEKTGAHAAEVFSKDVRSNLFFSTDLNSVVSHAETDLVIEAITENIDAKKALWAKVDALAPPSCVFCSNTSSLSITEQASVTKRPQNFAGMHFFSPVVMMRLVEIVRTEHTDSAVLDRCVSFVREIQKESVICRDTKGFIVNRLLVPFMLEAARLVERGDATVEDVDKAMRLGAGHPMGPFTLYDSIGLDVVQHINKAWHEAEPKNELFQSVPLLEQKVKDGKLGRKSGEGFFSYKK